MHLALHRSFLLGPIIFVLTTWKDIDRVSSTIFHEMLKCDYHITGLRYFKKKDNPH